MPGGQLTRNVLFSWTGFAVRLLITFLFIPYITGVLGQDRYGVWVICFQVMSYLSLLDLGVERSLSRLVPAALGRKDTDGISRVLNTATLFYLLSGGVVLSLTWSLAEPIMGLFEMPVAALRFEGTTALRIVGLSLAVRLWLTPFGGSLGAFQRWDLAHGLQMAEDIVRTLLMVWALWLGAGLPTLAWIVVLTGFVRLTAGRLLLAAIQPEVRFSPRQADRAAAGELFRYARVAFGIAAAWVVIFNTDSLLLGALVSTGAAGVFAPAGQLFLYLRHIINAVATPLTTAIAQAEQEHGLPRVHTLFLRTYYPAVMLSAFACAGIFTFAQPFVDLWLSPDYAAAGSVMGILALGAAVFVPQIIGNAVLFGLNRHGRLLLVLGVEAILKVTLGLMLIPRWGLTGMAWATTLSQLALYTVWYPALVASTLGLARSPVLLAPLRYGLLPAAVTLITGYLLKRLLPPTTWPSFGFDVAAVTLAAAVTGWFTLKSDQRSALKRLWPFAPRQNNVDGLS